MRRQVRVKAALFLGLALLLTACPGEGETDDPCSCPNSETLVPAVDWLGSGQTPDTVIASSGRDGFRHRVDLHYRSTDALASRDEAVRHLTEAGFIRSDDSDCSFRGDEWLVQIQGAGGDVQLVIIFVEITEDDRAGEILQPIAVALGTLP